MAGQAVWHRDDIGRACESVLSVALSANDNQSTEFLRGVAIGVMAVAHALGTHVNVPHIPKEQVVEVIR